MPIGIQPLPCGKLHAVLHHPGGWRGGQAGLRTVQIPQHLRPHGRGTAAAADLVHRRAAGIAHPHPDGVMLRPADGPVVAHVFAGAGFDGAPKPRGQHAIEAKGRCPGQAVRQDIAHDKRRLRANGLALRRGCAGRWVQRRYQRRNGLPAPPIGQGPVGVGQAQQIQLAAAQGQAVAVIARRLGQVQAELRQLLVKIFHPHHGQGAHRRHVQRRSQRHPGRHPAFKAPVVVLRDVQARAGVDVRRRVFNQRCGGQAPLLHGLGIQKRFQGGAGLALGQHAIDLVRLAQAARRSHPGQHLAAGVVQHQHRAVFNVVPLQLAQMALQALQRHPLHIGAQRGGDAAGQGLPLRPLRQHAPRPMRGHAAAGRPQAGA